MRIYVLYNLFLEKDSCIKLKMDFFFGILIIGEVGINGVGVWGWKNEEFVNLDEKGCGLR